MYLCLVAVSLPLPHWTGTPRRAGSGLSWSPLGKLWLVLQTFELPPDLAHIPVSALTVTRVSTSPRMHTHKHGPACLGVGGGWPQFGCMWRGMGMDEERVSRPWASHSSLPGSWWMGGAAVEALEGTHPSAWGQGRGKASGCGCGVWCQFNMRPGAFRRLCPEGLSPPHRAGAH